MLFWINLEIIKWLLWEWILIFLLLVRNFPLLENKMLTWKKKLTLNYIKVFLTNTLIYNLRKWLLALYGLYTPITRVPVSEDIWWPMMPVWPIIWGTECQEIYFTMLFPVKWPFKLGVKSWKLWIFLIDKWMGSICLKTIKNLVVLILEIMISHFWNIFKFKVGWTLFKMVPFRNNNR